MNKIQIETQKIVKKIKEVFEALRGINRNSPLDPIVYTPKEISNRIKLGDFFIKRVLKEGKVVY